ncbi:DUF2058 domain-containing protein [Xanthomonas rydalmerensis]|uniref:DUF2058 family protein n=5 Tax=Xanthomonas TaxID=338 RepID=A0ABZ0JRT5_9XANT|nr:DUF2058 family protein [Xanthomonas sp. DM-2023]WOS42552.1 DUF2058 family protein [Xanthomonas sp. DM-2023]WOS46738.1 DUF2058 family protein [Xanthomonas sp. DM-2023]WOS50918.1 DUF2058 family protein [Xanthomonas sp. DM-2023]WOS55098.1 DUF2058 family protein [Xanthomonas sp. DM-2023]WOS59280.1 DUF2058 family protein [Xanthomonas sp. DM-2023]
MSDTLREQLLGLGFKPAPKPERKAPPASAPRPQGRPGQRPAPAGARGERAPGGAPNAGKPGGGRGRPHGNGPGKGQGHGKPHGAGGQAARPPRSREDIDLAKAYAIRAQREKDERIEAERQKQEEARLRREARAKLDELLKGQALNHAEADIARHFPYGGKIKRIYVTADQLKALNAGELGVLQQNGRYLLVTAALLDQAEAIFPAAVALRVDPNATAEEDPYADPKYQIPDDLVW